MTVYVDDYRVPWRGRGQMMRMSHLTADTPEELHAIADQLGLQRSWYQDKGDGRWHYDVSDTKRNEAIQSFGAVPITLREMGAYVSTRRKAEVK
jgi:hypothetical protein